MTGFKGTCRLMLLGLSFGLAAVGASHADPTNVFTTQFEAAEGYQTNQDLVGQNGWTSDGTGGSGILAGFIPGYGQQAYIGFTPPTSGEPQVFYWKPINFDPVGTGLPVVTFSAVMSVVDSTSAHQQYDAFDWTVFNQSGHQLFTLDFDNLTTNINYQLDGATSPLVDTGRSFTPNVAYQLIVTMDFANNRWSAWLDDANLVNNQPMTTTSATLDLGDVDAVWYIANTNAPGDNFLLFDNYQITANVAAPVEAQVEFLGRTTENWALVRVYGPDGSRWAVDASTDLISWTALKTNVISGTSFDLVDTAAPGFANRFYRARQIP